MSKPIDHIKKFIDETENTPVYRLPDDCLQFFQPCDDNFIDLSYRNRAIEMNVINRTPTKGELLPYSK